MTDPEAGIRSRPGVEILLVLGVSLGISAIGALLYYVRAELTVRGGIAATTATVVSGQRTAYQWLDLADQLLGVLNGVVPALLALYLLARAPGGPGLGIGFDLRRTVQELPAGIGFTALIGLPGLALVWLAHRIGANAQLAVVDFPDVWYRIPYLVVDAAQNGLLEEVVMIGFMLTRLRELGWSDQRAVISSAVVRGGYHLYQGYGGFAGNLVMGLIFGWWFQRTRRVLPLVLAHTLLDGFAFLGYLYLHGHISWI